MVISNLDPWPGVDSITMSPPTARTRSLITVGPRRSSSSSPRLRRPEKGNPRPSSLITSFKEPFCEPKRTTADCAPLCLRMLTRPFLDHSCHFAAGGRRKRYLLQLGDEAHSNSSVSGETFHESGNKVKKLMGPDVDRAHALHQFAKIEYLLLQKSLNALQLDRGAGIHAAARRRTSICISMLIRD